MKWLMGAFLASMTFGIGPATAQLSPQVKLELSRTSMAAGESATLTWKVLNAEHFFISELGQVAAEGYVEIRPSNTTKYTLISENSFGTSSKTVELEVIGGRGPDDYPAYELFKYPRTFNQETLSLVGFLEKVRTTLQDSMRFTTKGPQGDNGRYLFQTTRSERSDLLQATDKSNRISRRRISYFVEVEPTDFKRQKVEVHG